VGLLLKVSQRVELGVYLQDDIAALAAVAPRRPAARHIFLAPEGDGTVAAIPSFHMNLGFIEKHECT
jgi:hypothetical protein